MKDVLKKLAEALPAELKAEIEEDDYGTVLYVVDWKDDRHYVSDYDDSIDNAAGTTVLKQYIESEGYSWALDYMDNTKLYQVYATKGILKDEARGDGDNEWQAVAKAALEVARRVK